MNPDAVMDWLLIGFIAFNVTVFAGCVIAMLVTIWRL